MTDVISWHLVIKKSLNGVAPNLRGRPSPPPTPQATPATATGSSSEQSWVGVGTWDRPLYYLRPCPPSKHLSTACAAFLWLWPCSRLSSILDLKHATFYSVNKSTEVTLVVRPKVHWPPHHLTASSRRDRAAPQMAFNIGLDRIETIGGPLLFRHTQEFAKSIPGSFQLNYSEQRPALIYNWDWEQYVHRDPECRALCFVIFASHIRELPDMMSALEEDGVMEK